jgi:hypothetical protein
VPGEMCRKFERPEIMHGSIGGGLVPVDMLLNSFRTLLCLDNFIFWFGLFFIFFRFGLDIL